MDAFYEIGPLEGLEQLLLKLFLLNPPIVKNMQAQNRALLASKSSETMSFF